MPKCTLENSGGFRSPVGPAVRRTAALGLAGALALAAAAWFPAPLAAVDDAALRAADANAGDWLTYGHGYLNQRFSPLKQIDRDNVQRMVPLWIYQTGLVQTFPTSPLVSGGRMVFSTPFNHVVSLDAATGAELWRYRHRMQVDRACCGVANRGVALGYGRVFMITADARLIALDEESGGVVWDVPVADANTGTRAEAASELWAED